MALEATLKQFDDPAVRQSAAMDARIGVFYFYSAPERLKEAYEHLARAYRGGARGVKLYLGGQKLCL